MPYAVEIVNCEIGSYRTDHQLLEHLVYSAVIIAYMFD